MTGRRTRWTLDVVRTLGVAFLVALCAGRIVAWLGWLLTFVSERLSGPPAGRFLGGFLGRFPDGEPWWWLVVPVAGAVLAVLVMALANVTPVTADAYAHGVNQGRLGVRQAPSRLLALACGVGAGVPLGADAPMMYLGGSAGAFVARRRTRWPERWFVLASATAALAMVVGAPIAAALFAGEVARRGVPGRRDRLPLAIGAIAAWLSRRLSGDVGGVLGVDPGFSASRVAVGAVTIGVAAGLVGRVLVPVVRAAQRARLGLVVRLCIAVTTLVAAGGVGWWTTGEAIFLGPGDQLRQWAAGASQLALLAAAVTFAGLVVAMVVSGVVGGLFLPLLSLGAVMGVLIGRAWLPDVPYSACVGIGACCLLAAAHHTPLAATAVAFATFGWSTTSWLAVAGVALASAATGDHALTAVHARAVTAASASRWRSLRTGPR